MTQNNKIKIVHLNCFHLESRYTLFIDFLNRYNPDLILLNEIKMDNEQANFYQGNIRGYTSLV